MLQLNPPIPVVSPLGNALCHVIIDYGPEQHLMWVCLQDETGECWTWPNPKIKAQANITLGRFEQQPATPEEIRRITQEQVDAAEFRRLTTPGVNFEEPPATVPINGDGTPMKPNNKHARKGEMMERFEKVKAFMGDRECTIKEIIEATGIESKAVQNLFTSTARFTGCFEKVGRGKYRLVQTSQPKEPYFNGELL
jgi:hypothetical protein